MQQNVLFTLKAWDNLGPCHGTERSRNAPFIKSLQAFYSLIQCGRRWSPHAWTQRKQIMSKMKTCAIEWKDKKKALASHHTSFSFWTSKLFSCLLQQKGKLLAQRVAIWLPKTGPINQFSKLQLTSQQTLRPFPHSYCHWQLSASPSLAAAA